MPTRKKPKQERAKVTADAIVEATGQVFGKGGFESTTTTNVARRAGVSIGSLYQYFPDKKALIAKFFEQRIADDFALMEELAQQDAAGDPRELLAGMMRSMIRLVQNERELYASVVDILPMMEQTDEVRGALSAGAMLFETYLRDHPALKGRYNAQQARLAARMTFHGVRSALFAVVEHCPESLDDPELSERLTKGALALLGFEE
ncbi:MAG: TetR/AcrR family transcriptional regulator [Polyangiales bacterium]